jgi:hypothetical protein
MKTPFNYIATRNELAALCDIPSGERTGGQAARHLHLTDTVARMKAFVKNAEALKAATKGRIIPVMYAEGNDETEQGEVEFIMASTGIVLRTCLYTEAISLTSAMLLGATLAA